MLSTPPAATATELTEKRMFMLFPTPMFHGKAARPERVRGVVSPFIALVGNGELDQLAVGSTSRLSRSPCQDTDLARKIR